MNMKKSAPCGIFLRLAAVLLSLVLFTSWLTSGLLAKYVTAYTGTSTARVARFDGGTIEYEPPTMPSIAYAKTGSSDYHAFVAEFKVTFSSCEVTRKYKLEIYLSENLKKTTLICPTGTLYTIDPSNDKNAQTAIVSSNIPIFLNTASTLTAFSPNNVYYAIGTLADGATTTTYSEWQVGNYDTTTQRLTIESINNIPMNGETIYFKLAYFVQITDVNGTIRGETSFIFADMTCEQVN
ncbi:MAG: hypothetical protein IJW55_00260 [Clostridia bacterium]|nr:hypothetical protein [Clostridia bacterium]